MRRFQKNDRSGVAMLYVLCTMVAMMGLCSFAVDYGRVRMVKAELQMAADSAALYGVTGLRTNVSTAQTRAIDAANDNKVDGADLTITNSDIEFGVWHQSSRTFTLLVGSTAQAGANAIRVTTRKTVPTLFAAALGRTSVEVHCTATASRGKSVSPTINAGACPWLAGMPNNSTVAATGGNPQVSRAPAQSPTAITGLNMTAGSRIVFRQASGQTSWDDGSDGTFGPDGDTNWDVTQASANGINSTTAPIGSMVGIFLNNNAPNTSGVATAGDFSTSTSRNFTSLSPPLKQVFFIGDGLNSTGYLQEFVVPSGATRLYVGIMDEHGWWWDNNGTLSSTVMDGDEGLVQ